MPAFAAVVSEFNRQFHADNLSDFARNAEAFAPGQSLDAGLILKPGTAVHRTFSSYLARLPKPLSETLRCLIHSALSASPPQQITLAWAPAYDFELTVWPAPCGMTVLLKSRYPSDAPPDQSAEQAV
jgi:hypothetical protein